MQIKKSLCQKNEVFTYADFFLFFSSTALQVEVGQEQKIGDSILMVDGR